MSRIPGSGCLIEQAQSNDSMMTVLETARRARTAPSGGAQYAQGKRVAREMHRVLEQ